MTLNENLPKQKKNWKLREFHIKLHANAKISDVKFVICLSFFNWSIAFYLNQSHSTYQKRKYFMLFHLLPFTFLCIENENK